VVALDALATSAKEAGLSSIVSNVGNDREISIRDLARLVIERSGSRSQIKDVSLNEAYGEQFEDIRRRRPNLSRLRELTGFKHRFTLEQTIDDLVVAERERLIGGADGHYTMVRNQSERAA